MSFKIIYRDSKTGQICSKNYAFANPDTTEKEIVQVRDFQYVVKEFTTYLRDDEEIYEGWKEMLVNVIAETFEDCSVTDNLATKSHLAAEKFLHSIMYTGGN